MVTNEPSIMFQPELKYALGPLNMPEATTYTYQMIQNKQKMRKVKKEIIFSIFFS